MNKLYFAQGDLRVEAWSSGSNQVQMRWAGYSLEKPDTLLVEFLREVSNNLKRGDVLHFHVEELTGVGSRIIATLLDWLCQVHEVSGELHIHCASSDSEGRYLVIALEALAEQLKQMDGAQTIFHGQGG